MPGRQELMDVNFQQSVKLQVYVSTVEDQGLCFHYKSTTLSAGTTATWKNDDSMSHTVTSMNGKYGSDVLRQCQEFSYTFLNPGTYDYRCAILQYTQARLD